MSKGVKMIMSQGEKMVWAASFVSEFNKIKRETELVMVQNPELFKSGQEKAEQGCVGFAVGMANSAVEKLREFVSNSQDEGVNVQMLRAMLGDDG